MTGNTMSNTPSRQTRKEPPGEGSWDASRRSFLKLAGFTFAAAVLPGCGTDEVRAVPFLEKPEEVTPGLARFYATRCGGCEAGCGILAKSRDGRPIKVEGNPLHPLSGGSTCAVAQAGVLSLYDAQRLGGPVAGAAPSEWGAVDAAVRSSLARIRSQGGAVRFLTGTVNGPTRRAAIERFLGTFADARHVTYDALSSSAALDAHADLFGVRVLPRWRFDVAEVVVSVDADFLGPWVSPVEHTRAWRAGRRLDDAESPFSHHVQFESRLSLTGSNADRRVVAAPHELPAVIVAIAARIAQATGAAAPVEPLPLGAELARAVEETAARMTGATGGRALLVCGVNDPALQRLTAWTNHRLGSYRLRETDAEDAFALDLVRASHQRLGSDTDLGRLIAEIEAGQVSALFLAGCNPAYDLPGGAALAERLRGLDLVVSFAERIDETAEAADYVCPDHHPLESWDDAEPLSGLLTVSQPVLDPLGGTRAFTASLAAFTGAGGDEEHRSAYDLMRETWRARVHPRAKSAVTFDAFWNAAVHDGVVEVERAPATARFDAAAEVTMPARVGEREDGGLALILHPTTGLLDGRHAHNPWLQELPDPLTKTVWDNHASLSPRRARELGVATGDVVRIRAGETGAVELPALVQPGQHDDVVTVALGYGRKGTDRFAGIGPDWIEARPTVAAGELVGVNAAPLLGLEGGALTYVRGGVTVERTGASSDVARTQIHGSLDVPAHLAPPNERRRPHVQETTLEAWRRDPSSGAFHPHPSATLWPDDHEYEGRHWGMAVDLTACTGCSACVIACQAENNVPVVGKDEVRRSRDMHWIRVDRYIQGEGPDVDVVHQPMMCQHCDNAPCETVCPVLATVHSSEGLNQQVYNRCVGTRYCANNCPYKTRRFNWFDYPHDDLVQNLALNPDVTVRSRGVMEKCSFCAQRISEAKAEAQAAGRPLADGDVRPACQQACPASALVFGDTNDTESGVRSRVDDARAYHVLADLDVRPSVAYLTLVRNRRASDSGAGVTHG